MAHVPGWIARRAVIAAALLALAQSAAHANPDVIVTIKPLHGLTTAIMEGVAIPHLLMDGGASPHTYAMKPSDVRRLNKAQVIVRVSKQLEVFLEKPLSLVSKATRIVTVDEGTPGLTLLPLRDGDDFEAHAHDSPGTPKHSHTHGHSHGPHRHEPHAHAHAEAEAAHDTHLWLDPRNAKAIVRHLTDVLAEAFPADAATLRKNGERTVKRLDSLDTTLAAELAQLADRRFLVFHDAYQYFERRYRLAVAGSVTINPEVPPSARRLSEIRSRIAKLGVACVFAEPQFAPRIIDAIVENTEIRQGTLDPLGASIAAGPAHYISLMEGLARDLKACLGGTG